MKYFYYLIFGLIFVMGTETLIAQPDRPPGKQGHNRFQRLEKFRKMRLIEILNLKEEDAARFTAKHSAHENTMQQLMGDRNQLLDDIETAIKENHGDKEYRDDAEKVLEIDKRIFDERRRFQEEMRGFLTPEQFARFLVFERNFGRQVRNAIDDMHQHGRDAGE